MKKIKKILKISGLVILIVLAFLGIGIAGGIPVSSSNRKESNPEVKIELLETRDDSGAFVEFEIKP